MSSLRKYIVSERFIHDGLLKEGAAIVKKLYDLWKRHRRIDTSLLIWPSKHVKSDDGSLVTHIVAVDLPPEKEKHVELMKSAFARVDGYALMLIRREGSEVKAILESPHGTRSWTIPIIRSADVEVFSRAFILDDREHLGIVWTPKQGSS